MWTFLLVKKTYELLQDSSLQIPILQLDFEFVQKLVFGFSDEKLFNFFLALVTEQSVLTHNIDDSSIIFTGSFHPQTVVYS